MVDPCPDCGVKLRPPPAGDIPTVPRELDGTGHTQVVCLKRRLSRAEAEIKELRTPDFYWPLGNEECPVDDPYEEADQCWPRAAILHGAKGLDWEVHLASDPNKEEPDGYETCRGLFGTLAEAEAAAAEAEVAQVEGRAQAEDRGKTP